MATGRKKTTGRFKTREELEQHIWYLYHNTSCNQSRIATNVKVSETTVAKVINGK